MKFNFLNFLNPGGFLGSGHKMKLHGRWACSLPQPIFSLCHWIEMQTGTTMADQIDLLREQFKMLAGEVAFCTSSLKRLIEQSASSPEDVQIQVQIEKTKEEIQEKRHQMQLLEDRIKTSDASNPNAIPLEISQV
jgi:hypothetical protein